jgi:LPXTG-site transpeptidase (sortase) family protein
LGVDGGNLPEVPRTGYEVAWYNFSAAPGTGSNAVFAGHVTWEKKRAVFWDVKALKAGDTVKLIGADGRELVYEVFANFAVEPTAVGVMRSTSEDIATLITCGGTWVPNTGERFGGHYTDRIIVQARLTGS